MKTLIISFWVTCSEVPQKNEPLFVIKREVADFLASKKVEIIPINDKFWKNRKDFPNSLKCHEVWEEFERRLGESIHQKDLTVLLIIDLDLRDDFLDYLGIFYGDETEDSEGDIWQVKVQDLEEDTPLYMVKIYRVLEDKKDKNKYSLEEIDLSAASRKAIFINLN
jgi:hypothetical protein